MEVPLAKQIEIYDALNARHTITDQGIDELLWEEILLISNMIQNK